MTFLTAVFGILSFAVLIHSLWLDIPRRWTYTVLSFFAAMYLVLSFPLGNLVFSTGGVALVVAGGVFLLIWQNYTLLSIGGVLLLFLAEPIFWVLKMHSSGVGTEFSAGYSGFHLIDGTTAIDFKALIFVGLTVFLLTEINHRVSQRGGLEALVLSLIALCAGIITFNVDNLIVLYLNLELQALALYTLVGYHRERPEVIDSSLRYLLAGSLVSAITLIGFIQIYSINGTFQLSQVHFGGGIGSLWVLGMLLFKLGAAPFYFWTPTVYQPLDITTLALVVGPAKINLWFLLLTVFAPIQDSFWISLLLVTGLLSVAVGAVGGYFQSSVTSLLAYSGILNTGYLLLLASPTLGSSTFAFSFYLGVYVVSTAAVIVVLSLFSDIQMQSYSFWSRLGKPTPLVLYYLVLNLAGLPVFPGFFGKLYLVEGVLVLGWLVVILVVLLSIIPGLYYVGMAAQALFAWSEQETKETQPGSWTHLAAAGVIIGCTTIVSFFWTVFSN
jgi:NADH-quinone oxidoreductase subunit N